MGRALQPVEAAKTPRIVIAQTPFVIEHNVDMVVKHRRRISQHQPQATRHTQVNHQRASIGFEQEIFCPPADANEVRSRQKLVQCGWHRPA